MDLLAFLELIVGQVTGSGGYLSVKSEVHGITRACNKSVLM